jgi:hypothetical protein
MVMKKKPKKDIWFIHVRGSYLPVSWQGWLTYLPYIMFLVVTPFVYYQFTNSVLATVYAVVPIWLAAVIFMSWLAAQKSR